MDFWGRITSLHNEDVLKVSAEQQSDVTHSATLFVLNTNTEVFASIF